jgi:hypothetical protein
LKPVCKPENLIHSCKYSGILIGIAEDIQLMSMLVKSFFLNEPHKIVRVNAAKTLHSTTTEKRSKTAAPPSQTSIEKTAEVKTAAEKERRGRHHHTERATAVQRTNAAVLLHPRGHRAACRNTESEATLACAGTTNPPHSTPHSLVRGDCTNPPHGSTLQTRLKDCRRSSTKRCPALRTKSSCRSPQRLENISLLPPRASRRHRARSPKKSPAPSSDVVPHRRNSVVLKQPRRNSLQAMSPLAADAASAVRRRCPAPHRGVPSSPSRRRTLQADESAAEKRPSDSN